MLRFEHSLLTHNLPVLTELLIVQRCVGVIFSGKKAFTQIPPVPLSLRALSLTHTQKVGFAEVSWSALGYCLFVLFVLRTFALHGVYGLDPKSFFLGMFLLGYVMLFFLSLLWFVLIMLARDAMRCDAMRTGLSSSIQIRGL